MDGIILTRKQLQTFSSASRDERIAWTEMEDEFQACLKSIGGKPAISFVGDGPRPARDKLIYEDGVEVMVVLAGDDDEALRFAAEEADREVAIADDFEADDALWVVDVTDGVDGDLRTFELGLGAGTYYVDFRESAEAQLLVLCLEEDDE